MSFVCHLYKLAYNTCMSLVCARLSSVCHLYVLVCHSYVTRMYSYVILMSLVSGFYHEHHAERDGWKGCRKTLH